MSDDRRQPFAVLDFETDPAKYGREPKAFACGFFDGRMYEYKWADDERHVLSWACEKVSRFPGVSYAHNGGRFDFLGYLFRSHPENLYGQRARLIGSRLVQMKYGAGEIRDSFAILPSALSAFDKGEINDYGIFERGRRDKHRAFILEYLKRDCTSAHALIGTFIERHGNGPLTAASAGMRHAKSLGYDFPRLDGHQDATYRQFYFGGRVESFWTGADFGRFHLYDIKSAYPHAMLSEHCASNVFDFIANPGEDVQPIDMVAFEGFARGCFPIRTPEGLRYPDGQGKYFITGWEYLEAKRLKLLGIHKVLYVERPTKTSDFRRYVLFWFAEKEKAEAAGDRAGRLIAKIMLNALYGKYAQRPDRWREYVFVSDKQILEPKHEKEGWIEEYVDEVNHFAVWSSPSKRPPTYYNVATAASITGFVRARIMRAVAEWSPLYTDTDSVITRQPVETSDGVGGWSLDARGDFFACAGKKLYALRLVPDTAKTKLEAKRKGYYWQAKPFEVKGRMLLGGRAWKIASKGCRMTPKEMVTVALGGEVKTFNDFPTFSVHSGTSFISRTIRKTA